MCGGSGRGGYPSCVEEEGAVIFEEGDEANKHACDDSAALGALSSEFFRRENKPIDSDIQSRLSPFHEVAVRMRKEGQVSDGGLRFKRPDRERESRG